MTLTVYDPSQNSITIAGHTCQGVISINTKRGDAISKTINGISEAYSTRIRTRRKPFTVTVTLLQTSITNVYLQQLANASENSVDSFVDILILGSGGVVHLRSVGYIETASDLEQHEELVERVWTFKVNPSSIGGVTDLIV
jgi:hypothetical protein